MRDPFEVQRNVVNADRRAPNELMSPDLMPSGTSNVLGNGDAGFGIPTSDSLIRHQIQRASGPGKSRGDEFNKHLLDPEIMELYYRSRSQEEEILLLRKQVADAFVKELQLLNEKHILERKLSELRMELDEKQDDAISSTVKELTKKKNCLEENLRLANDLKVVEEELHIFTSSLLSLLAEFNIRPPMMNAFTIGSGAKRLYHHMHWKIRSANAGFDDINHLVGNQPSNLTASYGHQPSSSSKSQLSQPFMGSKVNDFPQYNYYPMDMHVEARSNQSRFIRDYDMPLSNNDKPREVGGTSAPNFFEDNTGESYRKLMTDSQFYMPPPHDNQASSVSEGEASLPGIEGFQIIGEAKPGNTLRACGYPTNGTTLCIFQWVRHLQDGTRQYIEGATVPEYVVTADDVDTLLAVDCTPMDDNGRQGELVRQFANNQNKITCDQDMQQEIEGYISSGKAQFNVLLLMDSSEDWEPTTLTLKRSSYQIKVSRTEAVVVEEKYSPNLYIKVPCGHSTQFVLISFDGANLPFCTDGMSQPYYFENDVRLRDIIVMTMRYFQSKALDGKKKGKI
ncbi:uncharacterized protein LOC103711776 isoform X2 [Phoenix dactylifera]|uniref:Uncharacterized protein LOC103711776 isoform X2 n=1 Tax=Phoenix dactylifera TaxID=42345 RepID=A0A8B7CCE9_PHODC|nr:uncharacterized protein LOC103711776 isoform X2 [Phoenix dactylifera]